MKLTYTFFLSLITTSLCAQSILDRAVPVECKEERLGRVLKMLSHTGDFYFSYNSAILDKDSLVTLPAANRTLRQTLNLLFQGRLEYLENGRYIILRPTIAKPSSFTPSTPPENDRYTISGIIVDEETGEKIGHASIYDPRGLIATLSKEDGSFTVHIRSRSSPGSLTVSKEFYEDTTILLRPRENQRLTIVISPITLPYKTIIISPNDYLSPDSTRTIDPSDSALAQAARDKKELIRVEITPLGRLLLSSRWKIQSLNIKKFFTEKAVQMSFLPGLGTHGFLSPQISNKVSLNILGGYTGGLKGAEAGGLFNIDKKEVRGFQAAGLFNVVGGAVTGMQAAGLHNTVLDSAKGMQAAGISNIVKKKFSGFQAAGIYNQASDTLNGMQAAGVINIASQVRGLQAAGVVNYTHHLKGMQIGVINIADTSEGFSLGLINIIRNGYHELSFFADEVSPLNLAFRSGNAGLYTIFLAGINTTEDHRLYYYGFGLGHSFLLSRKGAINTELSADHLAPAAWDNFKYSTFLYRLNVDLHWRFGKYFSLSAGPSMAIYTSDRDYALQGHTYRPIQDGYRSFTISGRSIGWAGWRVAVNFF